MTTDDRAPEAPTLAERQLDEVATIWCEYVNACADYDIGERDEPDATEYVTRLLAALAAAPAEPREPDGWTAAYAPQSLREGQPVVVYPTREEGQPSLPAYIGAAPDLEAREPELTVSESDYREAFESVMDALEVALDGGADYGQDPAELVWRLRNQRDEAAAPAEPREPEWECLKCGGGIQSASLTYPYKCPHCGDEGRSWRQRAAPAAPDLEALRLEAQKDLVRRVLDAPPGGLPHLEAFKGVIGEHTADLEARVRRETIEECARVADRQYNIPAQGRLWSSCASYIAKQIRALAAPAEGER